MKIGGERIDLNRVANEFASLSAVGPLMQHDAHEVQCPRILRLDGENLAVHRLRLSQTPAFMLLRSQIQLL